MEKGDLKIDKNTVVHCTTEELANKVLAIADKLGYRWEGESYKGLNRWGTFKEQTCYNLTVGRLCNIYYYKNEKYNIIEAENFLKFHENNVAKTDSSDIDWEQRRYEIAKSAVQGYCIALGLDDSSDTYSNIAKGCIRVADELIKQLKK